MNKLIPYILAGIVMVLLGGIATFFFLVQGFAWDDCLEIKGQWDQTQNRFIDPQNVCEREIRTRKALTILVIPAIPAFWLMSLFPKIEMGLLDSDIILIGLSYFLTGVLIYWVGKMIIQRYKKRKR